MSGEAGSRAHLDLPGNQQRCWNVIVAVGKPVVLLVFSGRPLVLTWAAQHVPVHPRGRGIPAPKPGTPSLACCIGDVAPSGKLPMSFPQTEGQEPLYYNQLPTGRPPHTADLTQPPGSKSRFISRYIDAPNAALVSLRLRPFLHHLRLLGRHPFAQYNPAEGSGSESRLAGGGDGDGDEYRQRPPRPK